MFLKHWSFLIIIIIMSCGVTSMSQESVVISFSDLPKKEKKWMEEAIQHQRKGNNKKAMDLYNMILEKEPNAIDAILRQSGILYGMDDFQGSKAKLLRALELDPDYDKEIYYSLALISEKLHHYSDATKYIKAYVDRSDNDDRKYDKAIDLSFRYAFMAEATENPVPFDPTPLPSIINSPLPEYTPGLSADGSELYFVRRISNQEDILVATIIDSSYTNPLPVEEILTMDNEGVFTISPDGRTIIFTACNRRNGFGSCDLFFSKKDKYGNWKPAINMGKKVNSVGWDSHPSLSGDGRTLFFSSRRHGSIGASDIWQSTWSRDDGWSMPENLGGMINTPGSDETPFIHPDGKTLYFRSDGRIGMGGFDIFVSRYDEELKQWGVPKNLGYPINTIGNEGGLIVSLDGNKAYYSSDNGTNNVDIFEFDLYDEVRPSPTTYVKLMVRDVSTNEPLEAEVIFQNLTDNVSRSEFTDINGNALLTLPLGKEYSLTIEKQGFVFFSENFDLDSLFSAIEPFVLDISLIPLEKEELIVDKPIILKNIFFRFGSAELEEKSFTEINRLIDLLKKDNRFNITIIGHTDNIGLEEDNLELSSSRAKAVFDALVRGGIANDRITYVGKGETEPVASNDTEEGRKQNRRTEFILTKR